MADDLVLTPPEPVDPLPVERAAGLIALTEDTRSEIERRAAEFSERISELDYRAPTFATSVEELLSVGESDMRAAASIAGSLLDRSLRSLERDAGPHERIALSLADLRSTVNELDPSRFPITKRKVLGMIPLAGSAKKMLDRYRAANEPVNALVVELRTRQDQLRRDNAAIAGERERLWRTMSKLSEAAALSEAVDAAVDRQVGVLDLADPGRATALRSDVLHPIRQRHQDVLTQLAVCAQGYLALDLLRRNNDELVRGVERAVSTTVSALRIALVISAALANQRDVLDEVDALRSTTDGLIRANTELLSMQSDEVRRAGSDPAVGVETIRSSFERIYQAIDAIDEFKASATHTMSVTVSALSGEIRRAEDYLRRSRGAEESA